MGRALTASSSSSVETTPQEWQFLKPDFTPAMPSVSQAFSSLEEARDCLDGILISTYHGEMASLYGGLATQKLPEEPDASGLGATGGLLRQWQRSFDAFLAEHNRNLTSRQRTQVVLLDIQRITGTVTTVSYTHLTLPTKRIV